MQYKTWAPLVYYPKNAMSKMCIIQNLSIIQKMPLLYALYFP